MHTLPKLPYAYNALEPYIDEQTMVVHHTKHHQAYVDKLNAAIEKHPELFEKKLEDLIGNLIAIPDDIRTAIRNHGGGHYNHSLFWKMMRPFGPAQGKPEEDLLKAIENQFKSFDAFKELFSNTAANHFGS